MLWLQSQGKEDGGKGEDDGRDDGDSVEVAFHHRRSGHRTAERAPAEHVGKTSATPRVQEDEHDQQHGRDHVDHEEGGGDDHGARYYNRRAGSQARYRTSLAKSSASRDAPPTRAPSISGLAISSATLP